MTQSSFEYLGQRGSLAPFEKGGGRPQSGRRGICSSRQEQIPHKPLLRLVAPFFKGGNDGCLPVALIGKLL